MTEKEPLRLRDDDPFKSHVFAYFNRGQNAEDKVVSVREFRQDMPKHTSSIDKLDVPVVTKHERSWFVPVPPHVAIFLDKLLSASSVDALLSALEYENDKRERLVDPALAVWLRSAVEGKRRSGLVIGEQPGVLISPAGTGPARAVNFERLRLLDSTEIMSGSLRMTKDGTALSAEFEMSREPTFQLLLSNGQRIDQFQNFGEGFWGFRNLVVEDIANLRIEQTVFMARSS